jgi:DNA-binding CsgD family transcriptional regulator
MRLEQQNLNPIRFGPVQLARTRSGKLQAISKVVEQGFDNQENPQPRQAPTHLRLRDVRALFRLINEIRELGADPQKWRPHMVRRLRGLLGASIVVSSEIHFRKLAATGGDVPVAPTTAAALEPGERPAEGAMRVIDIGWVSDPEGHVSHIHTERDDTSPDTFWLTADPSGPGQIAPPNVEDVVPVKPARKVYGGTAFILSQIALPHVGAVDQLGLHREWGDRPFTPAEHRMVRIFHVELARLWKRDVLRRAGEPGSDLPPRLNQTLTELLNGASEKQIAAKLKLSPHTIHNYVKALHQRFGVSSRGELLAKAGLARSESGPRLSLNPPRTSKKK